jgi:sugar/nucleoside kinase (ribokinase family)
MTFSDYGSLVNAMKFNDHFQPKIKTPKVLGTGLIALDVVINTEFDRVPFFWAGGTCGNVMTILSSLGWDSYPVARLNGDSASRRVLDDLKFCQVSLNFACTETQAEPPIIIHTISKSRSGEARHRFSFNCPHCGAWLPNYKPVLASAAKKIITEINDQKVFFFDRLSRASIILAEESAKNGALVVFEPISIPDRKLFEEALSLTHILKYSGERFRESPVKEIDQQPLLEIQTLGSNGLKYRSNLKLIEQKDWQFIEGIKVNKVIDTAGSGDWCTAGIIDCLGREGFQGFENISIVELEDAIKFGQALGAWNCQFEGARGGMYQFAQEDHNLRLSNILATRKTSKQSFVILNSDLSNPIKIVSEQIDKQNIIVNNCQTINSQVNACCF